MTRKREARGQERCLAAYEVFARCRHCGQDRWFWHDQGANWNHKSMNHLDKGAERSLGGFHLLLMCWSGWGIETSLWWNDSDQGFSTSFSRSLFNYLKKKLFVRTLSTRRIKGSLRGATGQALWIFPTDQWTQSWLWPDLSGCRRESIWTIMARVRVLHWLLLNYWSRARLKYPKSECGWWQSIQLRALQKNQKSKPNRKWTHTASNLVLFLKILHDFYQFNSCLLETTSGHKAA